MKTRLTALVVSLGLGIAFSVQAKLPPAPPLDEKGKAAAEEKKKKDAETAEKAKAAMGAAQEKAVKSFQANMKKAGKPVPKPTPVVQAAPAKPAPAKPAEKAPAKKS
ncbi:MAG: hypothetical protein AB7P08_12315 [Burkholderiales bacterium]